MGMNLRGMLYLQDIGLLSAERNRILDIGPQNVFNLTEQQIETFIRRQGLAADDTKLASEVPRLVYFSTPRPEERTTLFSEVCDLTNIEYNSFDVCPALKTELLDLNYQKLPSRYLDYYDVVLNFGTTEHIFNQWNSFEVMHDAVKTGGIVYHQLPASGYLDHGYFCYTPLFFEELSQANGYEIVDMFFTPAGVNHAIKMGIDVRNEKMISASRSVVQDPGDDRIPCYNVHAVLRKTRSGPFRVSLEIATAHAPVDEEMLSRYRDPGKGPGAASSGSLAPLQAPEDSAAEDGEVPRIKQLEKELDEARSNASHSQRRSDQLASDLKKAKLRVEQLETERDEARSRGDRFEGQYEAIRTSTIWRSTAPVRRLIETLPWLSRR